MSGACCGSVLDAQFVVDMHQRHIIAAREMRTPARAESPLSAEGKAS